MVHEQFYHFQNEFFRLYEAGKYDEALYLIRIFGGQFPNRAVVLYNWRMCLAALTGRPEEALRLFREALDLGVFWPEELLRDSDLAALQGAPEFERLVSISTKRFAGAQAASQPELAYYPPEGEARPPFPLLYTLHGKNGNGRENLEYWQDLAEGGWLVASPQSSQMAGLGSYVWDDLSKAESEALSLLEMLAEQQPVDRQKVVLSGFSQGGGLALHLALTGVIPALGVIGVAAALPPAVTAALTQSAHAGELAKPRVYLITGDEDPRQPVFDQIEAMLQAAGCGYHREQIPHLGHGYPLDWHDARQRALDFILL